MLPKEEKISKKLDSDQPGLFDKENEKDRISKKRKFVYIAMFLTIGLSLSFWGYRRVKTISFSPKLPSFDLKVSTPKTNIFTLPKDINSTWSLFLKKNDSDSIIYQNNQNLIFENQGLETIVSKIDKSKFINSSPYSSSLPEGLKIKEFVEESSDSFSYFSKIIAPNQELLVLIKINNSKNLIESKKLIPGLVDQLYWYSLQK